MIIKGRARGGGSQLAAYLMDAKNERVSVLEITGTQQNGLRGALREMEAVGLNCTSSQAVLYHAQIVPAHGDLLTEKQFMNAVDRLEAGLGLSGQPRAIVSHLYEGHAHLHIVWSRADVENEKVISNSWDRRQHHALSRQLEREWDLERVSSGYEIGGHEQNPNERDTEYRQNSRIKEEAKQLREPFRDKDLARKEISHCFEHSLDGQSLKENLRLMGYTLAEGRTGPIALDEQTGVTYSIARYAGVTRDEARAKCEQQLIPKREELSPDRQAGHGTHLSRRKAARLQHDQIASQVSNDTGNLEINRRRAWEILERLAKERENRDRNRSRGDDYGMER